MSVRSLVQAMHRMYNKTHKTTEWLNLIGKTMIKNPQAYLTVEEEEKTFGCFAALKYREYLNLGEVDFHEL